MTKILIATPAYGRQVTVDYLLSVRALEAAFRTAGIGGEIRFTAGSNLAKSRNALASMVLNDGSYSHLLFVDADMAFRPEAVLKLVRADKDFSGLVYPAKTLNWRSIRNLAGKVADDAALRDVAQDYVTTERLQVRLSADGSRRLMVVDGFVRTKALGCGVMLVSRRVLERMRETYPELVAGPGQAQHYAAMGTEGPILQVFETVRDADGIFLSEDYSFCWRWTEGCGGEIWACLDEEVGHVGAHRFDGKAAERFRFFETAGS